MGEDFSKLEPTDSDAGWAELERRAAEAEYLADSARERGDKTEARQNRKLAALLRKEAAQYSPPAPSVRANRWTEGLLSVIRYHYIYSLAGLVLGLGCVVGGIVLFFHGVVGSTSWIGGFLGAQSKLSDAAPGTVLFVVGLFIVWVTRFNVEIGGRTSSQRSRPPGRPQQ